jgi:aerobic-type carbon monoxide dehydrogenase small subunit (CoxS/CutS family)
MIETIGFKLNGKPVSLKVDSDRLLLWVLRGDLNATGTKCGCSEGWCGACTVLVNNQAVLSCQTPVKEVKNTEVITIEGLTRNGSMHPLQKAFMQHDAFQCGFCTPGMILKAYSLLYENPTMPREKIIEGMEGNLCRCGAHIRIIEAIETAVKEMKGGTT